MTRLWALVAIGSLSFSLAACNSAEHSPIVRAECGPDDPCAAGPLVAVKDVPVLSPSEVQMARLVALDLDLQAIADTLTGGSLGSARIQVAELCAKLGVLTLPEAAQRARMMGFV